MDPSRLQQPVGVPRPGAQPPEGGVPQPVDSSKDTRLSYFRDNIQDPHELDDYDPSEYYYHRPDSGKVVGPGAFPGVPPPGAYYGAPGMGPPGGFVAPGPHTMPPAAMSGRPAMAGQVPIQPVVSQGGPASAMGLLRGFLSGPSGQMPYAVPPAAMPHVRPAPQPAAPQAPPTPTTQAQMSIALTANVQNPPRGLPSGPVQSQPAAPPAAAAPPPVPAAPVPVPAVVPQPQAQPRAPSSYSAVAVSSTSGEPSSQPDAPGSASGSGPAPLGLDPSEFPTLQPGAEKPPIPPDFSIHNEQDFPALGGEPSPSMQLSQTSEGNPMSQGAPAQFPPAARPAGATEAAAGVGQWQKPFARMTTQPQPSAQGANSDDRFGLLGLLGVIRMSDVDHTTLALGTDLTTLGLNLNSPELLYESFSSPWADGPGPRDPDYTLPACYYLQPPLAPPVTKLQFVTEETLFYIFHATPMEALQVAAAKELFSRDWRYHKELKLWFQKAPDVEVQSQGNTERGTYIFFDLGTWEKVRKDDMTLAADQIMDSLPVSAQPPPQQAQQSNSTVS